MTAFTNQSKKVTTWLNFLRKGRSALIRDMANMRFTDVAFDDGTQVKDVTFAQLVDTVYTNASRNSTSWSNQSRN